MQNDQGKSVKNSLFNPNVTGSTYEDFAQHATLFPAQQPEPKPVPEQTSSDFTIEPTHPFGEVEISEDPKPSSNFSSILSSFSNIWKENQGTEEIQGVVQEPTPVTYTQDVPENPPEITLYNPSEIPKPQFPQVSAPPTTGAQNSYRRPGTRRAVYAPIPGLSSGAPTPPPNNPPASSFFQPRPEVPPESNSPFLSPVQEISPNTFSMPTMSDNETPNSNNLPYAYRQDNFLPTANIDVVNPTYRPVYHHWFFKKSAEGRTIWEAFSMHDSQNLEAAFTSTDISPETVVATDGGRYDVNILRRERSSVYWKSEPNEVRRCSWFHKGSVDGKYIPFDENVSAKLEEEFKIAFETNSWNRKVDIPNGETVIFHGNDVLVLFPATQSPDTWGNTAPNQPRPRVVKRGMDEFDIDEGESETVDHLLFMVHGIGAACDLKFRSVEEVVDEFRTIALQLIQAHYRSSCDRKIVNRVEILPISWHDKLHSEDTGIDNKLKGITLESIPKLREFTNDTLLDILFYTSPVYGQTIISSVANELNSIYSMFLQRNPSFKGGVSLGGHSLGSLILFDILRNQRVPSEQKPVETAATLSPNDDAVSPLKEGEKPHPMNRSISRRFSFMLGTVGTGQPEIMYPQLLFQPHTFFALGSPIGMFVAVRGLESLGDTYKLPTCPGFFNIFHPYDPVAYRIEGLIDSKLANVKPVLIPHHKGRKRMHLELKETMTRVGADIKQKLIDSMKNTWNSLFPLSRANTKPMQPNLEAEVDKVIQEGFSVGDQNDNPQENQNEKTDLNLGMLNKGRRIDYVLQEAPVEFFNEYIFTLSSHLCYWESEDTILMILKEIYGTLNVAPDNQIPQQTMTIERYSPTTFNPSQAMNMPSTMLGVDPTMPINKSIDLGPPPMSGFVKKS